MSKDPRAIEPLRPDENIPSFLLGGGSGSNKPKGAAFVVPAGTETVAAGTRQDVIPEMPKRRSEREDVPSGFVDQFKPPPPQAPSKERRVTFAEEKQQHPSSFRQTGAGSSTYDWVQPYFPWIAAAVGILGFYYYYNYYQPQQQQHKSRK